MEYRYQALPPPAEYGRSPPFTRVLYLAPGVGDESPLAASLEVVDIQNTAPYEALSYMWGPATDEPREYLWLGPCPLPIKPNLEAALRALRLRALARRLWIDAVCINQDDVDERSRQVRYMRLVYKHATRVIVWLGLKTAGVEQAFELARRLAQAKEVLDCPEASGVRPGEALDEDAVSGFVASMLGELPPVVIQHLSNLFARPYFTRTWCIQEVVAASWVIVKVEEIEMPFLELISTIPFVVEWRREVSLDKPFTLWYSLYVKRHLRLPFGASEVEGSMGDLLHLLEIGRGFQATDIRDKFFAMLGVCDEGLEPVLALTQVNGSSTAGMLHVLRRGISRFNGFMQSISPNGGDFGMPRALRPDYRKDVVAVYTDLTRFLVRKSPRMLDVLDHVQHNQDPSAGEYPSWVPKWFEPTSCYPMKGCFLAGLCDGHFRYFAELHDCSLRGQPARPKVLSLDGFRVDVVQSVTGVMEFGFADDERTTAAIEAAWAQLFPFPMLARDAPPYRNGEPLEVALCNALAACPLGFVVGSMSAKLNVGRASAIGIPSEQERGGDGEQAQKCQREIANFLAHVAQRRSRTSPPGQGAWRGSSAFLADAPDAFVHFMAGVRMYSLNRRAFLTRDGRLGVGPKMMQPGDEVAVFFGGRLPFVIRPRAGHHVFVGSCYVRDDELMWGTETEKIKFEKPGSAPVFTFELR
jgi:hypothetical protein